jgi:hypothetical protein
MAMPHKPLKSLSTFIGLALVFLISGPIIVSQTAEPVSIDSRATLPEVGRTENLSGTKLIRLFPLEENAFTLPLDFPGASSFRLHFSVLKPVPPGTGWTVKVVDVLDPQKVFWTFTSDGSRQDFWTGEIRGARARVVVNAGPVVGDLQLMIDRIARLRAITTPLTELHFKLKPISQFGIGVRRAGRGVARLLVQPDGEDLTRACTGFLVGRDILMTNRHCIKSGSEARNADVQFDYDVDGGEFFSAGVKEVLLTSCDLDFVLLRLDKSFGCQSATCSGPLERTPFTMARDDASVTVDRTLVAIQHPDGAAKQVSQEGCAVKLLKIPGTSSTLTDFGHECDTRHGSSGAPLQLVDAAGSPRAVVGLHHLGLRVDSVQQQDPLLVNRAVSTKLIIAYINQVKPALLAELFLQ